MTLRNNPSLGHVAATEWLKVVKLEAMEEVAAFATFKAELGGGLSGDSSCQFRGHLCEQDKLVLPLRPRAT